MQMVIRSLLTFRCMEKCGEFKINGFFGVAPGDNCLCMKRLKNTKVKTEYCDKACSGDDSKACGGMMPGRRRISLMNVWTPCM